MVGARGQGDHRGRAAVRGGPARNGPAIGAGVGPLTTGPSRGMVCLVRGRHCRLGAVSARGSGRQRPQRGRERPREDDTQPHPPVLPPAHHESPHSRVTVPINQEQGEAGMRWRLKSSCDCMRGGQTSWADPEQTLRRRPFLTSKATKGSSPTIDRVPLSFNQDIAMLYLGSDEQDDRLLESEPGKP